MRYCLERPSLNRKFSTYSPWGGVTVKAPSVNLNHSINEIEIKQSNELLLSEAKIDVQKAIANYQPYISISSERRAVAAKRAAK